MAAVPGHLPHREALAMRVTSSAAALEADAAVGAALAGSCAAAGQRARTLAAAAGPAPPRGAAGSGPRMARTRWAPGRPAPGDPAGQAVRERGCVLFSQARPARRPRRRPPGPGRPRGRAARAGRAGPARRRPGLDPRRHRGGSAGPGRAAGLGAATGTAVLLSTADAAAATALADAVRVVVPPGRSARAWRRCCAADRLLRDRPKPGADGECAAVAGRGGVHDLRTGTGPAAAADRPARRRGPWTGLP